MGGEDFGRIGGAGVPIVMMSVGSVSQERLDKYRKEDGSEPSLHSPQYYPDVEPTITTGVTRSVHGGAGPLAADGRG